MIPVLVPQTALQALPDAIWMLRGDSLTIYRGDPLEIVKTMASEMGEDITITEAVRYLLVGIRENLNVEILLPNGLTDEALAATFLYALLDKGVGRRMPQA